MTWYVLCWGKKRETDILVWFGMRGLLWRDASNLAAQLQAWGWGRGPKPQTPLGAALACTSPRVGQQHRLQMKTDGGGGNGVPPIRDHLKGSPWDPLFLHASFLLKTSVRPGAQGQSEQAGVLSRSPGPASWEPVLLGKVPGTKFSPAAPFLVHGESGCQRGDGPGT